jgi:hypothetical protein
MVLRWIRSIPTRAHSQSLGRVNDRAAKPNNGYARSENILVLLPRLAARQCQVKKQRQLSLSTPQTKKTRRRSDKVPKKLKGFVTLYVRAGSASFQNALKTTSVILGAKQKNRDRQSDARFVPMPSDFDSIVSRFECRFE